jgi:tetratricopeptide (TPR) repeat protein
MSPAALQDVLERAKGSVQVGDHDEAERLLKQYLLKIPDSRDAHLLLGTTLAKAGKLTEAADEFTTMLAKNPQDLEALNNMAVIYRRQGKLQDALGVLIDAIDIDPTRAEFHYNIGNIHKQLGNFKAASMAYAKVVELDPRYVPAYNNLGTIYDQTKEYDKAFNMFRKGLSLDRNNPTLHFNYGVALEANGRLEDAAGEYRASLRSKPGWVDPMNNLGIVLFKQGQHKKAMDTFNRILDMDPFNAEARNNMGVVLNDQGRTREAVQNYRRAIEADPKYVKAVVNLERALESSGDFGDAVVELEKLVKLTPDSAEVHFRLAGLYLKLERYPEALEEARAALEWDPENIQALRIMGTVQRILGDDQDAKAAFEKILSIDPGNYIFHLDLADIHFRRKEYKEAENRINAFLARRPNDRGAKLLLGRLYAEMGNRTHAIQIFEELARADPNDTEALAAAAELHREAGSIEKAVRAADTLVNLQGKRGTSEDLSSLNESLEFYENAVNAYSNPVKEMWDRNIKAISGAAEEEEEDDMSLLFGSAGMAPVTDEETEALFIEDIEMQADEEDIILEDDQPLYDEKEEEDDPLDSLAEINAPVMPFQSGMPASPSSGGGMPAMSQAPQSQDSASQPPPQEQTPPSAQDPAQPPQASPREQPPSYPQPPQFPPPQPSRFPPPPPENEVQEEEESFPGEEVSGELPIDDEAPEDSVFLEDEGPESFDAGEEEVPLEAAPEEEEPLETALETGDDIPPEEEPEGEFAEEEELFGESRPEEEESLLGGETPDFPEEEPGPEGDEPETAKAAEPLVEEPVPEEISAGPLAEETPEAPEPLPPGEPQSTEAPAQPEKSSGGDLLGLMNYLKDLAGTLPNKDREQFMQSEARLSMEYIIDTLEGRKGLIRNIEERKIASPRTAVPAGQAPDAVSDGPPLSKMAALRARTPDPDEGDPKKGKSGLAGMLKFLAGLAGALPDHHLGTAINRKVDTVISEIKKRRKTPEKNGNVHE